MAIQRYTHRSHSSELKVHDDDVFGSWMFFSCGESNHGGEHLYGVELDEDSIINSGSLSYHAEAARFGPILLEIADRYRLDEDAALALLDESKQLSDFGIDDDDGEEGWWLQAQTARAAGLLGYSAVRVKDEYGHSYMIDCSKHEPAPVTREWARWDS